MAPENEDGEQLELFDNRLEEGEMVTLGAGGIETVEAEPMTFGEFVRVTGASPQIIHPDDAEGFYVHIDEESCAWVPQGIFHEIFMRAPSASVH